MFFVNHCTYQSSEFNSIESDGSDKRETRNSERSQVGVLISFIYLKEKVKRLSSVVIIATTTLRETYLSVGLISIKHIGDSAGEQLIIPGCFILVYQPLIEFN